MKIGVILIFVVIILAAVFYETRRRDQLAGVASSLGLGFQRGQQRLPAELERADFYLFTQGGAQILNTMSGSRDGLELLIFGYSFSAAFGDEGQRALPNSDDDAVIETRQQTVVSLRSQTSRLPYFDLSPTGGPVRSAGKLFDLQPVGFDGAGQFRKDYRLLAREPEAARRHFSSAVLSYLAAHPGLTLESRGGHWLFYRQEQRVDPKHIGDLLGQAEELIQLLGPVSD